MQNYFLTYSRLKTQNLLELRILGRGDLISASAIPHLSKCRRSVDRIQKNEVECTGKVKYKKGRISAIRWSMQGYILSYSSLGFSAVWKLISPSVVPNYGAINTHTQHTHTYTHTRTRARTHTHTIFILELYNLQRGTMSTWFVTRATNRWCDKSCRNRDPKFSVDIQVLQATNRYNACTVCHPLLSDILCSGVYMVCHSSDKSCRSEKSCRNRDLNFSVTGGTWRSSCWPIQHGTEIYIW